MTTTTAPTSRRRTGLAIGLSAGLLGGAAAGFAFGVPGVSSAATAVVQEDDPVQDPSDASTDEVSDADAPRPDRSARLRELLDELVVDGTITAEQADAVTTHLVENAPEGRRGGPDGRRGPGHRRGAGADVVTDLLGIDQQTLRSELQSGKTLAEVAADNGIDTQTLVDALVAQATERLDRAVENGRIDTADAAEKEAELVDRMTDMVNRERPQRDAAD